MKTTKTIEAIRKSGVSLSIKQAEQIRNILAQEEIQPTSTLKRVPGELAIYTDGESYYHPAKFNEIPTDELPDEDFSETVSKHGGNEFFFSFSTRDTYMRKPDGTVYHMSPERADL